KLNEETCGNNKNQNFVKSKSSYKAGTISSSLKSIQNKASFSNTAKTSSDTKLPKINKIVKSNDYALRVRDRGAL
ncbi:unnamed protein product, partial [Brachionus calyciflorus]